MKRGRKYFRNLKNSNEMVSDLVGTFVLLAIAVVIFSSLYGIVFSYPITTDPAKVTIIGTIEGDTIILEHRGGEALGPETIIPITIAGNRTTSTVRDLLIDTNGDGLWNIGERLVYPFTYNLSYLDADVMAVDIESNNLVLIGTLDIHPESDIGVKVTVDPIVDCNTTLRIKVTNYRGDMNASNITIKCKLPNGIIFENPSLSNGTYDNATGFWNIDWLNVSQTTTLEFNIKVKYTQLALLLDGSGSITDDDWDVMLEGISTAITNGYIPHNEQVELTVFQFGGLNPDNDYSWAQVELGGPIVLDNTNYNDAADDIMNITQLGGATPMSCAFRLAADIMSGDKNNKLPGTPFAGMKSKNSSWPRQVVNLITDGQPNVIYDDNIRYNGIWQSGRNRYILGKSDTELALGYFKSLIPIEAGIDEIDSEAVGDGTDVPWLRDHIVRPQPGIIAPPYTPGWVVAVKNFQELADTIAEQFKLIFDHTIIVEKVASTPQDPDAANNVASISII
jgi:hypothetical protein